MKSFWSLRSVYRAKAFVLLFATTLCATAAQNSPPTIAQQERAFERALQLENSDQLDASNAESENPWLQASAQARLAQFARDNTGPVLAPSAADCAEAPMLSLGQQERGWRFAEGPRVRWFKILAGSRREVLEAYAADDDLTLSAYSRCGAEPLAHADNDVLLQPRLSLPMLGSGRALLIKLEQIQGAEVGLSLHATGQISGSVLPAQYSSVVAYLADGTKFASSTVVNGQYALELPPDSYYLRGQSFTRVSQLYDNVECYPIDILSCNLSAAQLLPLAQNQVISSINFVLGNGATVAGRLTDALSNVGVDGVVHAQINGAGTVFSQPVDQTGRFEIRGLPEGNVSLSASSDRWSAPFLYRAQRYQNRNCPDSSLATCTISADPFSVPRDGLRTGVEFRLSRLSSVRGSVIVPGVFNATVQVVLLDANGAVVAGANSTPSFSPLENIYRINSVPVGAYRVRFAHNSIRMLYPDLVCAMADCSDQFAQAGIINVDSAESTVQGINAIFPPTRRLIGKVLDRDTGAGLQAFVSLAQGAQVISKVSTNAAGLFEIENAPQGPVRLFASSTTHIDAFYPDLDCQAPLQNNCNLASSTLTSLVLPQTGTTEAEFRLARGASFSGIVRRNSGVGQVGGLEVRVRTLSGLLVTQNDLYTNDGRYSRGDLQPGTYRVDFLPNTRFFGAEEQVLVLGAGQQQTGVDALLQPKIDFEGRITDSLGTAIPGVVIDLWDGSTRIGSAQTNASGWYWLENNRYTPLGLALSTDAPSGYTNEVHENIACPAGPAYLGRCSLRLATQVPSPALAPEQHVLHFQLDPIGPSDELFGSDFEIGLRRQ